MPKLNVGKRAPDLTLRASTGDAVFAVCACASAVMRLQRR